MMLVLVAKLVSLLPGSYLCCQAPVSDTVDIAGLNLVIETADLASI